ncbi:hypothetical protein vBValSX1_29 [Vibrio phage vB_ValS_X1]|uniref:Uncharacterized protein n=1 Tax=Vibrio phage vB_ValS_X1 TaxID=2736341 RepID=A0A6M9Z6Y9_9CAUD|nr:hypothetical protein vBValSX1_29 [Vibrio phage vB_ValS_X1]
MSGVDKYITDSLARGVPAAELRKELTDALKLVPAQETVRKHRGLVGREKLYVMDMALEIDNGQWRSFHKVGVSRDPGNRMKEVADAFSQYTDRDVIVTRVSVCEGENPRWAESLMLLLLEPFRAFSTARFTGATEVFTLFNKKLSKVIHLGDPYALDTCLSSTLTADNLSSAIFRSMAAKDSPDLPNSLCNPYHNRQT